ncbi:MAG: hypothetical protein QM537_04650 [Candidatus Symbiobacter sp.]|nr:hypothetical protein [Candidatus Symbiobacter sp.]
MLQNVLSGFSAMGDGFARMGQAFFATEQDRNERVMSDWQDSWNRIGGDLTRVMGHNGMAASNSQGITMTEEELNVYVHERKRYGKVFIKRDGEWVEV